MYHVGSVDEWRARQSGGWRASDELQLMDAFIFLSRIYNWILVGSWIKLLECAVIVDSSCVLRPP